jgi:dihydrolipoamide dehydrogenase
MGDPYDVVVIGAGTGGYATALRAAESGKRVAIVERGNRLGGTCLARAAASPRRRCCSAEVLDTVERASEWGIKAAGEPDWSAILAFQDAMVDKLVNGITGLIRLRRSTC